MFGTATRKEGSLDGCPRKWGAQYLDGVRTAYLDPALVFGIKFHKVCASLLLGEMPTPHILQPGVELTAEDCLPESIFGLMARSAIKHAPRNEHCPRDWQIEQEWLFPWVTRNGVECQIDLRPDVCADDVLVDLIDWKSAGTKRFTLTSIVDDVQANLYAAGLMYRFERKNVHGRWVYVLKSAPHTSWVVEGIFPWRRTSDWLHAEIDATIELIHSCRATKPRAIDLPGDLRACKGMGFRCDFAGQCLGSVGPKPSVITLSEIESYKERK